MTTPAEAVVERLEIIFLSATGALTMKTIERKKGVREIKKRGELSCLNDSLAGSTVSVAGSRLHNFP